MTSRLEGCGFTDLRRKHEDPNANDAALDFVRFCHRRWGRRPELYDETRASQAVGLYHAGFRELRNTDRVRPVGDAAPGGFVAQSRQRRTATRRPSVLGSATPPAESPADKPGDAALAPDPAGRWAKSAPPVSRADRDVQVARPVQARAAAGDSAFVLRGLDIVDRRRNRRPWACTGGPAAGARSSCGRHPDVVHSSARADPSWKGRWAHTSASWRDCTAAALERCRGGRGATAPVARAAAIPSRWGRLALFSACAAASSVQKHEDAVELACPASSPHSFSTATRGHAARSRAIRQAVALRRRGELRRPTQPGRCRC